jgi:hypothetical protein
MTDQLDGILRKDAALGIDDAGFSARVMGALPAPVGRSRRNLQPALVLGSAIAGSVLAILLAPADIAIAQGFVDLMHLRIFTPAAIAGLAMSAVMLVSAALLASD